MKWNDKDFRFNLKSLSATRKYKFTAIKMKQYSSLNTTNGLLAKKEPG
jgi:hypothetical protein